MDDPLGKPTFFELKKPSTLRHLDDHGIRLDGSVTDARWEFTRREEGLNIYTVEAVSKDGRRQKWECTAHCLSVGKAVEVWCCPYYPDAFFIINVPAGSNSWDTASFVVGTYGLIRGGRYERRSP